MEPCQAGNEAEHARARALKPRSRRPGQRRVKTSRRIRAAAIVFGALEPSDRTRKRRCSRVGFLHAAARRTGYDPLCADSRMPHSGSPFFPFENTRWPPTSKSPVAGSTTVLVIEPSHRTTGPRTLPRPPASDDGTLTT
jgi:hypothetical protein